MIEEMGNLSVVLQIADDEDTVPASVILQLKCNCPNVTFRHSSETIVATTRALAARKQMVR